jgi:hypothetical protein
MPARKKSVVGPALGKDQNPVTNGWQPQPNASVGVVGGILDSSAHGGALVHTPNENEVIAIGIHQPITPKRCKNFTEEESLKLAESWSCQYAYMMNPLNQSLPRKGRRTMAWEKIGEVMKAIGCDRTKKQFENRLCKMRQDYFRYLENKDGTTRLPYFDVFDQVELYKERETTERDVKPNVAALQLKMKATTGTGNGAEVKPNDMKIKREIEAGPEIATGAIKIKDNLQPTQLNVAWIKKEKRQVEDGRDDRPEPSNLDLKNVQLAARKKVQAEPTPSTSTQGTQGNVAYAKAKAVDITITKVQMTKEPANVGIVPSTNWTPERRKRNFLDMPKPTKPEDKVQVQPAKQDKFGNMKPKQNSFQGSTSAPISRVRQMLPPPLISTPRRVDSTQQYRNGGIDLGHVGSLRFRPPGNVGPQSFHPPQSQAKSRDEVIAELLAERVRIARERSQVKEARLRTLTQFVEQAGDLITRIAAQPAPRRRYR